MPGRGAAGAPDASVAPYDDAVTIEQDLELASSADAVVLRSQIAL